MTLDSGGFVRGVGTAQAAMGGLESTADGLRGTVAAAGGALAALSAGALAGATVAASRFESAMVEVEKVTSGDFASSFRDDILELSKTIPLSANAIADLTAQAGRFGVAEENVRGFVTATAKMAEATDLSATRAGEAFAKLATLTETPIPKIGNLGSAVNALSNNFATSSSEIVDSMLRSAGALSQLGASNTEIAGLSAALNATSESSERAGSRLRRLAQEMVDPRKVGDLASALGMTSSEFQSMVENDPTGSILKMAKAIRDGGSAADGLNSTLSTTSRQALAGLGSNLEDTRRALGLSAEAFRENTSLQEEFAAAKQTAAAQAQLLKNSIMAVAIETGSVLLPAVTDAIKAIRGAVDAFGAFNQETNGMAGVIVALAGVVAGLGTAFVALAGPIMTAFSAASTLAGALPTLGTVIAALTGPIGLAIAAAVAFYGAYETNFLGIRDIVDGAVSRVVQIVETQLLPIGQKIVMLATDIYNALAPLGQWLMDTFGPVLGVVGQMWSAGFDSIVGLALWFTDATLTAINALLSVLLGDTETAMQLLEGIWQRTLDGILNWVTSWPLVKQFASVFVDAVSAVESVLNQIPGVTIDVASKAKTALRNAAIPQTYGREYQRAGELSMGQLDQLKGYNQQSLNQQQSDVLSSGIPGAYGGMFGQAQSQSQLGLNGIELANGQTLASLQSSTQNSGIPGAFGQQYSQAQTQVQQGGLKLQTAHDGALGAMVRSTNQSGLPQATAGEYQASLGEQSTKLSDLRSKHQTYLRLSKQDTENSAMYKGFATMYANAEQKQRTKLNGMRGTHQTGLGNISTDTNSWALPSDVNTKYGDAAGRQSTRLGEMYGEHNSQFGNMTTATATELANILTYITTEFGEMLRVVTDRMSTAQSNFSGELGTMRSETSTKTGQMVGDFSSAFSTISRYASDIASEANMAASTARSALRSASNYRAAASRNAAGAAAAASGGNDYIDRMHSGGVVPRTGRYQLREGEQVLTRKQQQSRAGGGGGGSKTVVFEGDVYGDANAIRREVEAALGDEKNDQRRAVKRNAPGTSLQ